MQAIRALNHIAVAAILAHGSVRADSPPQDKPPVSYPPPQGGWEIHPSKTGTLTCNGQKFPSNVLAMSNFEIRNDGPAGVAYWSTPNGRAAIKAISPNNELDVRGSLSATSVDGKVFVRIGAYKDKLGGNRIWASVDEAEWQTYGPGSDFTWKLCSLSVLDN